MLKRIINKIKWQILEQPTFSRITLNNALQTRLPNLKKGVTMEIGAGKNQTLRNLLTDDDKYFSLNLLETQTPDIVANACKIPFADSTIDNIILVEVLEHITTHKNLLEECFRVLKPGGCIVGSTRFIFYEHAAPYDYHRFTHDAIKYHLKHFSKVDIQKMGNRFHVIMDILSEHLFFLRSINKLLFKLSSFSGNTCYLGLFFQAEK